MNLKPIFESIDSEVFTDELKEKVEVILSAEVEQRVAESLEKEKEALVESMEAEKEEFKTSLSEKVENYFDYLTQELSEKFLIESAEEVVELRKAALFESVKALAGEFGITIAEAKACDKEDEEDKEDGETEEEKEGKGKKDKEAEELKESFDKLFEEHQALKAKYIELSKIGLIKELSEGLTLPQAENFAKLAKVVELKSTDVESVEKFMEQLKSIKEALEFTSSEAKEEEKVVSESVKEETKKAVSVIDIAKKHW
jgi:tetrahydromethanopterin S-methyltransferase subunit G